MRVLLACGLTLSFISTFLCLNFVLYLALCVKINDYNVMGFYICLFLYNSNLNALWSRGKQMCGMKTPRAMYVLQKKAGRL